MDGESGQRFQEGNNEEMMQNKKSDKRSLFAKVLAGSCVAALGTTMASESVFPMTIFSVTVLAIVSIFLQVWR
jgi:hypothetical protein